MLPLKFKPANSTHTFKTDRIIYRIPLTIKSCDFLLVTYNTVNITKSTDILKIIEAIILLKNKFNELSKKYIAKSTFIDAKIIGIVINAFFSTMLCEYL